MNLSQTCAALINLIDQHELIARLFFSCLELAVLAVVATIVMQLLRPRTPRLNALVWALVLAKSLLTLVIGSPIHALQITLPANFTTAPTTEIALKPPALPGGEVPQRPMSHDPPAKPGARTPTLKSDVVANSTGATAGLSSSGRATGLNPSEIIAGQPSITDNSPTAWPFNLYSLGPLLLLGVWLAGVAIMLLRAAMVRRQLAKIFHGCQVPDRSTLELFSTIAASMQIRRTPQLRITDAVESPALVGSWRPTVLVPSWMAAQSDRTALAWSLRHELTHWKHGDLWLIRLRELAQAVFFFHPGAWWAGRQLELAIEIACDRAVIATDAEAADYAQRLYQILEAVRDRRRPALATGLFATRSQIARRLVMLVETPLSLRPKLSKPAAIGIAILAVIVLSVGIAVAPASGQKTGEGNGNVGKNDAPVPAVVGKVLDENGKPVADVPVLLYVEGAADLKSPSATASSDADGEFRFKLEPGKQGEIVADDVKNNRQGYAYAIVSSRPVDYQPRITLKPVRELTVKVVDQLGSPVAGASIAAPVIEYDRLGVLFNGLKTDENGIVKIRFSEDLGLRELIALKAGAGFDSTWIGRVNAPGEAAAGANDELSLRLSGAKTIHVKAIDKLGQPVAGVKFAVSSIDFRGQLPNRSRPNNRMNAMRLEDCPAVQAITGADGVASFDWIPSDLAEARFHCVSPDFAVTEKTARGAGASLDFDPLWFRANNARFIGSDTLTAEVARRTKLSGHVYDANNKPAAGVRVWAMVRSLGRGGGGAAASTNSEGAYEMLVHSDKAYTLTLFDEQYPAANHYGVVAREGKPVGDLDFHLTTGTTVRGTVTTGADHRPVADQEITLGLDLGPVPWEILHEQTEAGIKADQDTPGTRRVDIIRTAKTDAKGQYQFRVGPGTYQLSFRSRSQIIPTTPLINLTVDKETEVVKDIQLP